MKVTQSTTLQYTTVPFIGQPIVLCGHTLIYIFGHSIEWTMWSLLLSSDSHFRVCFQ